LIFVTAPFFLQSIEVGSGAGTGEPTATSAAADEDEELLPLRTGAGERRR
jgi:hypothetical protein